MDESLAWLEMLPCREGSKLGAECQGKGSSRVGKQPYCHSRRAHQARERTQHLLILLSLHTLMNTLAAQAPSSGLLVTQSWRSFTKA